MAQDQSPRSWLVINAFTHQSTQTQRPINTNDCPTRRPCPFVSCRYHLLLDVTRKGTIKLNKADVPSIRRHYSQTLVDLFVDEAIEHLATMADSCALDVAARGSHNNEELAGILGVTREAVRQLMELPEAQLKAALHEYGP
jgi:hypothetical protein